MSRAKTSCRERPVDGRQIGADQLVQPHPQAAEEPLSHDRDDATTASTRTAVPRRPPDRRAGPHEPQGTRIATVEGTGRCTVGRRSGPSSGRGSTPNPASRANRPTGPPTQPFPRLVRPDADGEHRHEPADQKPEDAVRVLDEVAGGPLVLGLEGQVPGPGRPYPGRPSRPGRWSPSRRTTGGRRPRRRWRSPRRAASGDRAIG